MFKKLIASIILSVISTFVIAQTTRNVFNDVMYLDSFVKKHSKIKVQINNRALFDYYFETKGLSQAKLDSVVSTNPFFNSSIYQSGGAQSSFADVNVPSFSNIGSSLGNLDVTSIANGVTSFLVKRAKEELFISVINKLKDPKKFPEFQLLFPNTLKLMGSFESWDYANVLNTLKVAFDQDLQQLLGDIPTLNTLKPGDYSGGVKTRVSKITTFLSTPDGRIFLSALQIGNGIVTGEKIPDMINTISGKGYLGDSPGLSTDARNAIKVFNIISYSLKSTDQNSDYITATQLNSLVNDQTSLNIYLGLIYQQFKNAGINLVNMNTNGIEAYITTLINQSVALDGAIKSLADAKAAKTADLTKNWAVNFSSLQSFIQVSSNITQIDPSLKMNPSFTIVLNDVSTTLNIANEIANRNYSTVVFDLINFIPDNNSSSEFKKYFLKYGSFAANLVQAKSADDAENAIEAVALPVGSYSIKQNSAFNISLNGYVGYAFDINDHFKKLYAQGIYAPVGFSFSMGTKCFFSNVTAFISPVDLGNLVSYQLSNPTTATTSSSTGSTSQTSTTSTGSPEIKLSNIFSPSAQLFFGIKGTPFAFGAGWRRTPTLHYSGGTNYSTVGAKEVFTANILIDIPIFTLLNTPYRK